MEYWYLSARMAVKKFLGNLLLLMLANLLIKPLWVLGIDREVQNTLGTEVYGNYYALFNFSFLLSILLDMGINNYNSKVIAHHPPLINKNLPGILIIKLVLALVYMLATIVLGLFSGYSCFEMYLLSILCINQIFSWYILYLRTNISALQLFKTDIFLSILDRLLMIVFCAALLYTPLHVHFQIEYFVYAQTLAYILTALVCFFLVKKQLDRFAFRRNIPFLLLIIKRSYPYALLAFLMVVYTRIDTSMLKFLLPASEGDFQVGIYAAAYRLLDAANMLGVLVASLLLPIFLRMMRKKEDLNKLVHFSFPMVVIPAMLLATYSWLYRTELMERLYTHLTPDSPFIFGTLMSCFIPICTIYIYGTLLTANESLSFLNKVAAISLLLNIGLNLWLIPRYQAAGAAISGLITQGVVAGCHVIEVYRKRIVIFNRGLFLKLLTLAMLFGGLSYWLGGTGINAKVTLILPALLSLIIVLVLNIFDRKSVADTLKGFLNR